MGWLSDWPRTPSESTHHPQARLWSGWSRRSGLFWALLTSPLGSGGSTRVVLAWGLGDGALGLSHCILRSDILGPYLVLSIWWLGHSVPQRLPLAVGGTRVTGGGLWFESEHAAPVSCSECCHRLVTCSKCCLSSLCNCGGWGLPPSVPHWEWPEGEITVILLPSSPPQHWNHINEGLWVDAGSVNRGWNPFLGVSSWVCPACRSSLGSLPALCPRVNASSQLSPPPRSLP